MLLTTRLKRPLKIGPFFGVDALIQRYGGVTRRARFLLFFKKNSYYKEMTIFGRVEKPPTIRGYVDKMSEKQGFFRGLTLSCRALDFWWSFSQKHHSSSAAHARKSSSVRDHFWLDFFGIFKTIREFARHLDQKNTKSLSKNGVFCELSAQQKFRVFCKKCDFLQAVRKRPYYYFRWKKFLKKTMLKKRVKLPSPIEKFWKNGLPGEP